MKGNLLYEADIRTGEIRVLQSTVLRMQESQNIVLLSEWVRSGRDRARNVFPGDRNSNEEVH